MSDLFLHPPLTAEEIARRWKVSLPTARKQLREVAHFLVGPDRTNKLTPMLSAFGHYTNDLCVKLLLYYLEDVVWLCSNFWLRGRGSMILCG